VLALLEHEPDELDVRVMVVHDGLGAERTAADAASGPHDHHPPRARLDEGKMRDPMRIARQTGVASASCDAAAGGPANR
jgi:hypothetical protein